MEKFISLLCIFALLGALTACIKKEAAPSEVPTPVTEATEIEVETMSTATETEASEESTAAEAALSFGEPSCLVFRDATGSIGAIGIVSVTNDGTDALLLSPGIMDFADSSGANVYHAEYVSAFPQIIAPGETAFYFEQVYPEVGDTTALSVALTAEDPQPTQVCRYDVSDTYLRSSPYGGLMLTGRVTNTTLESCDMACVAAVLYSESGAPLAVISTVLMETLPAGVTLDFTIESFDLPEELTAEAVADMEIFAYPMFLYD